MVKKWVRAAGCNGHRAASSLEGSDRYGDRERINKPRYYFMTSEQPDKYPYKLIHRNDCEILAVAYGETAEEAWTKLHASDWYGCGLTSFRYSFDGKRYEPSNEF